MLNVVKIIPEYSNQSFSVQVRDLNGTHFLGGVESIKKTAPNVSRTAVLVRYRPRFLKLTEVVRI